MRKILDVTLDEATHIYTDANKYRYDSVTTILNNYKEKFDPYKKMADGGTLVGNYAIKNAHTGKSEADWIAEWDNTRDTACTRGTKFHKLKEAITYNSLFIPHEEKSYGVKKVEEETDRNPGLDYSQLPDGVYPELTLFNRRHMIAGQADKVIKDGLWIDIDDYKTNGKFDIVSFKPPRGSFKMMKPPLSQFMDCHLYHYTMQLSTYGWMLERFGLKVRQLRLLHYQILPDDEKKLMDGEHVEIEPTTYIVKYEKAAVEAMIRHYTSVIRKRK